MSQKGPRLQIHLPHPQPTEIKLSQPAQHQLSHFQHEVQKNLHVGRALRQHERIMCTLHAFKEWLLCLTSLSHPVHARWDRRVIMVLLFKGGGGTPTPEDEATTASVTSTTSFQGIEQFNEKAVKLLGWDLITDLLFGGFLPPMSRSFPSKPRGTPFSTYVGL